MAQGGPHPRARVVYLFRLVSVLGACVLPCVRVCVCVCVCCQCVCELWHREAPILELDPAESMALCREGRGQGGGGGGVGGLGVREIYSYSTIEPAREDGPLCELFFLS